MVNFIMSPKGRWCSGYLYLLSALAITAGFILALISWTRICAQGCALEHNFRLYGLTFEAVGLLFFAFLGFFHLMGLFFPLFFSFAMWTIYAGLGSEIVFTYIQKYNIGTWCPVCLSIAAVLVIAGLVYLAESHKRKEQNQMINSLPNKIFGGVFFAVGFFVSFFGVAD
jgi:uncharacterized protein YjeT (DUF2065 family)